MVGLVPQQLHRPNFQVNKFLISFESDVPASTANPFSRPGQPLLNQIVRRGPIDARVGDIYRGADQWGRTTAE